MKSPIRIAAFFVVFAFAVALNASANLVQDSTFTGVTYSGTLPMTTLFGQFGSISPVTLTVANWSTSGYNFVYAPNTMDRGNLNGALNGAPNEAPGNYNTAAGYGNTYMWGSNNGGSVTLPATDPGGGNFIAMDGAFETGAVSQVITGLTAGKVYVLLFYWAGAQQQSYGSNTTESLTVSLGASSQSTSTVHLTGSSFSGWMHDAMAFTATGSTETLSFLAVGTPNGEPPFTLVGDINLTLVPDFTNWMVFAAFGVGCVAFEGVRRRRRRPPTTSAA